MVGFAHGPVPGMAPGGGRGGGEDDCGGAVVRFMGPPRTGGLPIMKATFLARARGRLLTYVNGAEGPLAACNAARYTVTRRGTRPPSPEAGYPGRPARVIDAAAAMCLDFA